MLHIHNNLTRKKEVFTPIDPNNVRLYVCGMTVYDFCHIGHARVMVVFDVVARYLRKIYGAKHVTYVRNITDIDDKIIKRANENGEPFTTLTQRFIDEMHTDADALGVLRPDVEPRATTHIGEIIAMIEALIQRGYAYPAKNGDVYYDVSKFNGYGKLSGKQLDELQAGARVEVDEVKDDPLDFVLWKAAKPNEPSWDSPWGKGRPGWHIECSAMSTQCLGDHFDIHGGGMDLQFPHHENEIAQSEGATGCKFVNVWMHNGFVRINEEKMSKSLGNFFTVRDVLNVYDPEFIRYFILDSHYRSPLDYSHHNLDKARASLATLYNSLDRIPKEDRLVSPVKNPAIEGFQQQFSVAMDDDFNTPAALAILFNLAGQINRLVDANKLHDAAEIGAALIENGKLLGLLQRDPTDFRQNARYPFIGEGQPTVLPVRGGVGTIEINLSAERIETLIAQRLDARKNKNWQESDRIRDELKAAGVILEDGPKGTTWRRP